MSASGRRTATIVASLALAAGIAACGEDEEETTPATEETASAEEVTLTTSDTADGYTWELSATPTAETKTIEYVNESEEQHALIFARINEGYTLEEAYELQGRKGSADVLIESSRKDSPQGGETSSFEIDKPIEPGNYALLCPIPGHYEQGQLEEFEIQ
jgi:uncharacterized cupredoxin-like copper-binding protein